MIAFSRFDLQSLFKKAYGEGCSCHGELNLKFEYYVGHLNMIIQRQLGANFQVTAAAAFYAASHKRPLLIDCVRLCKRYGLGTVFGSLLCTYGESSPAGFDDKGCCRRACGERSRPS